jgi:hypothetical protein
MQCWVVVVLLSALLCCSQAEASGVHGHSRWLERQPELLFDTSEPPAPRTRLKARDGDGQLQVDDQGLQIALPHPFDTTLGNNFTTTSCPAFFNDFLSNQTFNDCLPFSLLLQVRASRR